MKVQALNKNLLAKNDNDYLALLASNADWLVRTPSDLTTLRAANIGPIAKLSQTSFDEFTGSLKFSQGGLGHANYKPLMKDLSLTEVFDVFAHFGLSPGVLLDHADKKCASPGTCTSSMFDICTSSC